MTTREEFLTAIRANPADWQAYYVFADWLEEQGDELGAQRWRWRGQWQGFTMSRNIPLPWCDPYAWDLLRFEPASDSVSGFCERHKLPFVEKWPEDHQSNTITFTIAVDAGPVLSAFNRIQSDLNNQHT